MLRLADTTGRRRDPLHATSNGKLLLSTMSPGQIGSVLDGPLSSRRRGRSRAPRLLESAIDDVRRTGYAFTVDEFEMGVTSLSAGIHLCDELAGIVAVTGPTSRLDEETRRRVAMHAVNAARSIECSLAAG